MAEIGQVPGGGLPWGDIVKAQTPFTDQVAASLLAQNADRKKYVQETNQQTEGMLNKELANVRSIDMDKVMEGYGKYKNVAMQMLNPKVQADPKLYNQLQIQKNAALGETMGLINKSAQYNTLGKQIGTNIQSKTDSYSDESGKMLSTYYNTPMDKLTTADYNGKPTDLTDLKQYQYSGIDLSKLHETAKGKPVTHYDDGTTDASGVQTTQHGFQYGNTPLEYRNSYVPGLAGYQANRTARANWQQHSTSQQDLDAQDAAYQNSPNWKKLGMAPQPLPAYNPNDPVGNEATYQAKQYLIGMNPAEVKAATTTNEAAKMGLQAKLKLNGQEVMAAINEKNKEKMARVYHDYKRLDVADQSRVLDETMQSVIDSSKKDEDGKDKPYSYRELPSGNVAKEYKLNVGAPIQKALSIPNPDDPKHRIDADDVFYDEKNQTVTPIFYLPGKPHTLSNIDKTYSKPMTMSEFKAIYGKTYFGVKEAAKESGKPAGTAAPGAPAAPTGGSGIKWQ